MNRLIVPIIFMVLMTLAAPSEPRATSNPEPTGADLIDAALKGNYDLARQILDAGVDVNATNSQGRNAMTLAAYQGHADIIALLISRGASPDTADQKGLTAMMWAASYGRIPVVKLLIEKGADPLKKTNRGHTAYDYANSNNQPETAAFLKSYQPVNPAAVYAQACSIMEKNLYEGRTSNTVDIIKAADGYPIDFNQNAMKRSLLHCAARYGDEPMAAFLLQHGADPNLKDKNGHTPLAVMVGVSAIYSNSKKQQIFGRIAKRLVAHGADVNAKDNDGFTIMQNMKLAGKPEPFYSIMKEAGARYRVTPNGFLNAVAKGDLKTAEMFLKNGGSPNVSHNGITALIVAVFKNNADMVRLVLKYRPDMNAGDTSGLTALHHALIKNHMAIARLLKQNGARMLADSKGNLPGYYAYWLHGKNPSLASEFGYTKPAQQIREDEIDRQAWKDVAAGFAQAMNAGITAAMNQQRASYQTGQQKRPHQAQSVSSNKSAWVVPNNTNLSTNEGGGEKAICANETRHLHSGMFKSKAPYLRLKPLSCSRVEWKETLHGNILTKWQVIKGTKTRHGHNFSGYLVDGKLQLSTEMWYLNGEQNGPEFGYGVYNGNPVLQTVTEYKDGMRHGQHRHFSQTGQLKVSTTCVMGECKGL